ncbi:MAG TPA: YtxH domain-containing protein [Cytophagales bacterium]|nr:YtxH domain-containing protein [Cytophagales bacterium]HCR53896.1 YtxH domain-containing protein [Cytophagales bacterium]
MATKKVQGKAETPQKKKKSSNTGLKVAGGMLAGAAAGAIAGMLLAPDSGKNTRKKIADKTKKAAANVKGKVTSKVKEVAGKVKAKASKGKEKGKAK